MASESGDEPDIGIGIDELGWKSQEILIGLDGRGGTLSIGEVGDESGIDSLGSLNYQIKEKLRENGLVETMQPEYDGGLSQGKVITLTKAGEDMAERLRSRKAEGEDGSVETLGDRVERVETRQNATYGSWESEKGEEYENQLELSRVMRDFLLEKHGEEFKEYVDENFDP